jgi:predicted Zn-dependent protease
VCENPWVSLSGLDTAAIARALAPLAEQPDDWVDAFFEQSEEVELASDGRRTRVRRERGLAVRLIRGRRSWLACRDAIDARSFGQAVRQVCRILPATPYPEPVIHLPPWPLAPPPSELVRFPELVEAEIQSRRVAFPVRFVVRRHTREVQVATPRLVPGLERETFFSVIAELGWGRFGTLLPELTPPAAAGVAQALVSRFRARQAAPPLRGRTRLLLAPSAAAVLLHEAVAHALEADVLAASGSPERAIGLRLGPSELSVLDDPGSGPSGMRRTTDDEGMKVERRWLLRQGLVSQPLADLAWSRVSSALLPGAGRRSRRDLPPAPRVSHLEVVPGPLSEQELRERAEGGLFVSEIERGQLDPGTGRVWLEIPFARRLKERGLGDAVGPFSIRTSVADLLANVLGVGRELELAGAGWCAKGGQKLPVWASTPALVVGGVEVLP